MRHAPHPTLIHFLGGIVFNHRWKCQPTSTVNVSSGNWRLFINCHAACILDKATWTHGRIGSFTIAASAGCGASIGLGCSRIASAPAQPPETRARACEINKCLIDVLAVSIRVNTDDSVLSDLLAAGGGGGAALGLSASFEKRHGLSARARIQAMATSPVSHPVALYGDRALGRDLQNLHTNPQYRWRTRSGPVVHCPTPFKNS